MGRLLRVNRFEGEFEFLSNFSPHKVVVFDRIWPTAEHAFQGMKTVDRVERARICRAPTPGKAKRMGGDVELRPDWEQIKLEIMRSVLRAKFMQDAGLMRSLLDTGGAELVEGNHWNDTFWGVCRGRGSNHLGKLLMELRAEVKERVGA